MGKLKNTKLVGSFKINGTFKRRSDVTFCHRDYLKSVHRKKSYKNPYSLYKKKHPGEIKETSRRSIIQMWRKSISKDKQGFRESKRSRLRSISTSSIGRPFKKLYRALSDLPEPCSKKLFQTKKEVKKKSKTTSTIAENYMSKMIPTWLPLPYIPVVYPCCHSYIPNWCGTLNIWESVKCQIIMEPLPGHCYQFSHLKKNNLQIVGGIKRKAVWKCMNKVKMRGKKKVAIVQIKPLNIQESDSYNTIFNYFYTRRQIGHVGYRTDNMSFFLLLPLPAQRSLKSALKSFQTDSFSEIMWQRSNTNIILGIMLLQPHADVHLHNVTTLLQVSSAQTLHTSPFMYFGPIRTQTF